MGNFLKIFLLIGLIAGYTQTVHSTSPGPFSCWHCDSIEQQTCGDKFDVSGIEPLNCIKEPFPQHLYNIVGTLNRNVTGCLKTTTTKTEDNTDVSTEKEEENISLLCYHCSSMDDEGCSEDFEETEVYAIDCKRFQIPRYLIHVFGKENASATGCLKTTATGSAIQCYQCESNIDESCGDEKINLEHKHQVDCATLGAPDWAKGAVAKFTELFSKASGCAKVTNTLNGKSSIIRSCYWGNPETAENCNDVKKLSSDVKTECNVCTTDLCNGATTSATTYGLAVFITALFGRFLF